MMTIRLTTKMIICNGFICRADNSLTYAPLDKRMLESKEFNEELSKFLRKENEMVKKKMNRQVDDLMKSLNIPYELN